MLANDYKIKFLSQKAQIVLFNEKGRLLETCNTLIDVQSYKDRSLYDVFAFLESIQSSLIELGKEGGELYFPRVEVLYNQKEWVFDFIFKRQVEDLSTIVWIIQDLTSQYKYLYHVQKERNESIIQQELLEHKQKSVLLQKEIEYLNKFYQLKINYFSKFSHDIKIPVREINGITYFLKKHINTEEGKEYLASLETTTTNLHKMIVNLLELANLSQNKLFFDKKEFLLKELVNNIVNSFKYSTTKQQVPIHIHIDPDVPIYLHGDDVRLSQILYNLLSNALKFTTVGMVKLNVITEKQEENNWILRFEVIDTGKGIPKKSLSSIFTPYHKLNGNNVQETSGTGLGLTIVKELVESQGGIVKVSSEVDKGSTFSFTLPFACA